MNLLTLSPVMQSTAPFDQEAFLRDARSAAVESGDLDVQHNHVRLQKVRLTIDLSLSLSSFAATASWQRAHVLSLPLVAETKQR